MKYFYLYILILLLIACGSDDSNSDIEISNSNSITATTKPDKENENIKTSGINKEVDNSKKSENDAQKTYGSVKHAIYRIVIADLSMSLDNVLAVAGIARNHPWILIFGLALSIALMAVATPIIVRLLDRYSKLSYLGLVVILYIAITMIWHGIDIFAV